MADTDGRSHEIARQSIEVAHSADFNRARQLAGSLATDLGFKEKAVEEIILVVSELATNLVKHAGGGTLTLTPLSAPAGIEIESLDSGPGIPDARRATADGFSTAGSLGYGLGTVNRLMDDLEITALPDGRGTRVVCRRGVRRNSVSVTPFPLSFGVATRPYPGLAVNGDAFVIRRWGNAALVGIIDGLGHGQAAHLAAETARQYVETHFDQPLDALFRGTARACGSTRGVVMALARFDCASWKLAFASVGNVEARVFGGRQAMSFMVRRGVIGLNAPSPVVTEHPWQPSNVMVLHSDGLKTHWRWEDFPNLEGRPADIIARDLLRALARDEDDATVMVVQGNLP
ncbi:MAG: ATP-binding protein/SpoIIE family protein phosphatase [Actinobacteria bacterium]|nr:ATP-binding protein/SpoIIE family protein phosphatase [Actinomycetota bacterium]